MSNRRALGFLGALAIVVLSITGCGSGGADPPRTTAPERGWKQRGIASWYGPKFHGRPTASGEIFDMNRISAAHRSLPFGTVVRVENLDNGRRLEVRINDRGPFVRGRIIDLSRAAARKLGMLEAGVARVRLTLSRHAARSPRAGPSGEAVLWVQVAAFRDRQRARRLARELAAEFPQIAVYTDGVWHRVQLREVRGRAEAERVERRLRELGQQPLILERRQ